MAQPTRVLCVFVATLALARPAAPQADPVAHPAPVLDNVDLMDLDGEARLRRAQAGPY